MLFTGVLSTGAACENERGPVKLLTRRAPCIGIREGSYRSEEDDLLHTAQGVAERRAKESRALAFTK